MASTRRFGAYSQKRHLRLAQRKRKRMVIFAVSCTACLALATGGLSWLSYQSAFNITRIAVSGAKEISEENVVRTVRDVLEDDKWHVFSRSNILLYPKDEILSALEQEYPRARSFTVSRVSLLEGALSVRIEEREPYALWCRDKEHTECFILDETGLIYAPMPNPADAHLFVFRGGFADTPDPSAMVFLSGYFDYVKSVREIFASSSEPTEFVVINEKDYEVLFASGMRIIASFRQLPARVKQNMETVLSSDTLRGKEKSIDYIDLRFGNRVYFKMRD